MYTNDKLLVNIILHSIFNLRVSTTKDTYNMEEIMEQYC